MTAIQSTMRRLALAPLVVGMLSARPATAIEHGSSRPPVRVYPGTVVIDRPQAVQRLLVTVPEAGGAEREVTARFTSTDPRVARASARKLTAERASARNLAR